MSTAKATATIAAQNTGTEWVILRGCFNVSLSGMNGHTVTLQRSFDGESTILDVKAYTADAEEVGNEPEEEVSYRLFCKTGAFGTGNVEARISR